MFGRDPKDLAATLSQMHRTAIQKSNWNQTEARDLMREYLGNDKRFSEFDHGRLVERVEEARSCGRTLDFDDPWLRGGDKRPLSF